VEILVGSRDNSGLDLDKLKARIEDLKRQRALINVDLMDKDAKAKAARIDAQLTALSKKHIDPEIDVRTARAEASLAALDLSLERLGGKSGKEGAVGAAATGLSGLVTPMGAAVAAGVALSPVIATLGVGLGGMGAAAFGVISPIEKAAQKTGGLRANMASLGPEQQIVAKSLLGLGQQYHAFESALQPQVLGAFNAGIKIAGSLMRDVEPVAAATGKAFDSFLGQFGATLQDSQWKSFWSFMATTAPQDMQMLGKFVIDLTNDLPGLLRGLQPVATGFLQVSDAVAKGLGRLEAPPRTSTLGELERFFASKSFPVTPAMAAAAAESQRLAAGFDHNATQANAMGIKLIAAETDVKGLMAAQSAALGKQLAYGSQILTTANDAASLKTALKASGDQVGLHTQKQRDSFGAAQTYITDLSNTATAAISSGKGVGSAIAAIRGGLPVLDAAKSKNRAYWQEVATLKGWLDKLRAEKAITEVINITGTGSIGGTAVGSSGFGQSGKHFVGRFAHGGIVGAAAGGGPRGGLTMINEAGPELVNLPPGSQVHSNPDTQRMLAGGGGSTTIVLEVAPSGNAFDRFMTDWLTDSVQVKGGGDVQVAFGTRG
jgi:hypothetical protein